MWGTKERKTYVWDTARSTEKGEGKNLSVGYRRKTYVWGTVRGTEEEKKNTYVWVTEERKTSVWVTEENNLRVEYRRKNKLHVGYRRKTTTYVWSTENKTKKLTCGVPMKMEYRKKKRKEKENKTYVWGTDEEAACCFQAAWLVAAAAVLLPLPPARDLHDAQEITSPTALTSVLLSALSIVR